MLVLHRRRRCKLAIVLRQQLRTEVILLKRFTSDEGVLKELDVVQICVKEKLKTINTYIEAFCIPFICSPIR